MKKSLLALFLICVALPNLATSQDTNQVSSDSVNLKGTIKSKSTYLVFDHLIYNGTPIKGELKPNLLGTKYHVSFEGNHKVMEGFIYTKEYKKSVDLSFQEKNIKGDIKTALTGGTHKWEVDYLGEQLTGEVRYNVQKTKATFDLKSKGYVVTGQIKQRDLSVIYALKINGKSVKGTIKDQIPNNQKYTLVLNGLNENELALFFLIESIRVIDQDMEDNDDFQNGSKSLFDD